MTDNNNKKIEGFEEKDGITLDLLMAAYTAKKYDQYSKLSDEEKNTPQFDESPDLDERCLSAIQKEYKKKKYRQMGKSAFTVLQKVSVAVLAVVILCALIIAVSPAAKARVFNFFVFDDEDFIKIKVNKDDTDPSKSDVAFNNAVTFGYALPPVPDGFTLVRELTSSVHYSAVYDGQDNRTLKLSIYKLSDKSYTIDTWNADVSYIVLNGLEGLYYEKRILGTSAVTLVNSDLEVYITVSGVNIDKDTLISYAEQIEFVG